MTKTYTDHFQIALQNWRFNYYLNKVHYHFAYCIVNRQMHFQIALQNWRLNCHFAKCIAIWINVQIRFHSSVLIIKLCDHLQGEIGYIRVLAEIAIMTIAIALLTKKQKSLIDREMQSIMLLSVIIQTFILKKDI